MGRRAALLLTVLLAGLAACDDAPGPPARAPALLAEEQPSGGPYDAAARLRPDLLRIQPARAAPGAVLELHFPKGTGRGAPFAMEEWVGETWVVRYLLTSAADEPNAQPSWVRIEDSEGWEDIGRSGPGPDRVVVPDIAAPGRHRLCTANAAENFCAELEVTTLTGRTG